MHKTGSICSWRWLLLLPPLRLLTGKAHKVPSDGKWFWSTDRFQSSFVPLYYSLPPWWSRLIICVYTGWHGWWFKTLKCTHCTWKRDPEMNVIIVAHYLCMLGWTEGVEYSFITPHLWSNPHRGKHTLFCSVYSAALIGMKCPHTHFDAQQAISDPFPVDSATQRHSQCRFLS